MIPRLKIVPSSSWLRMRPEKAFQQESRRSGVSLVAPALVSVATSGSRKARSIWGEQGTPYLRLLSDLSGSICASAD